MKCDICEGKVLIDPRTLCAKHRPRYAVPKSTSDKISKFTRGIKQRL